MLRQLRPICVVIALCCAASGPVALAGGWEKLGEKRVEDRTERDEIHVGVRKGSFRWIKVRVEDHAVEFKSVIVVYANGERDEVSLRRLIRAGDESRPIRLERAPRVIRSIVFYYSTVRDGKRGKVKVYARD